jgi:hypothetical protein
MKVKIKNKIRLYIFLVLAVVQFQTHSAILEIKKLDFISVLPIVGSCSIDVDSGLLTGTICAGASGAVGDVGHFRITTTPSTVVNIVVYSKSDNGDGIVLNPSGKISTDSAADVTFFANNGINVNSGTSGEIDIYIGGQLTLTSTKNFMAEYTPSMEIEYN